MNQNESKIYRFIFSVAFRSLFLMGIRMASLVAKFTLTIFIARYIGFEELGIYGLISAACIVASSLLGLGLPYMISRNAVSQNLDKITDDMRMYSFYLCVFYVSIGFVLLITEIFFSPVFIAPLILALIFMEHLNSDLYQLFLNLSKPFISNVLHFIRSGLWIFIYIILALAFPVFRTLEMLLIAWLIGSALSLTASYFIVKKWPWKKNSSVKFTKWLRSEFRKSKIIYLNGLAYSAGTYIDRYIISFFLGLELTGVYVLYWSIYSALCNLIRTGVLQVARPKLVKLFKTQSSQYSVTIKKSLIATSTIASTLAIVTTVFFYAIVPYLNKPLALEWFFIIYPIMFSFIMIVTSEVLDLVFYSQHRDDLTLSVSIAQVLISSASNLALLPFLGLWGASSSMIMVSIATILIQCFYILKYKLMEFKNTVNG